MEYKPFVMESKMKQVALFCVAFSLAAGLVFGQATPTLRRNVLDASPQIGSGGYNNPVRRFNYRPNYGNLFITGNVTGGKSFQGFVPYSSFSQFQSSLGSSALSAFQRDSTSLQRIRSGDLYGRANPYFHRSSTIVPLSAQRNFGSTGSSMPRTSTPKTAPTFTATIALPTVTPESMRRLPSNIRSSDILIPSVMLDTQPRESPVFAKEAAKSAESEKIPEPKNQDNSELQPVIEQIRPEPAENKEQAPKDDFSATLRQEADSVQPNFNISPRPEFAESAKRLAVEGKFSASTRPAKGKRLNFVHIPPVTTLAGKDKSPFTLAMRAAQKFMNQGKYFNAYDKYSEAQAIKQNDPLPLFGMAHALIAAGKLRSASSVLKEAENNFKTFTRLDLRGTQLLGSKTVLKLRLNQIKKLSLKYPKDKNIKRLLAYIEVLNGK